MIKSMSILGSTGSIGTQALNVAENLGIKVIALTANKNIKLLEEQIRKFSPKVVAVYDKIQAEILKKNIKDLSIKVLNGIDGICEVSMLCEPELVLNSIVGIAGLKPTLCAIKSKKNIALANKETLVTGGEFVIKQAKEYGVKIIPVDSEHSAIMQCLQGNSNKSMLKKIILTASGGPFFGKDYNYLKNVSPKQALKHPNWDMGAKITIDSATMMNKGLEIIEAAWLFGVNNNDIDVIIHRESIVHSMIEYVDGSIIAQLGVPDMRIPIQYALTFPNRCNSNVNRLDLTKITKLSFFEPDYDTFKCLTACRKALDLGGTMPAAVNGANEQAVKLFLENKISFTNIGELVLEVVSNHNYKEILSIDDIFQADQEARQCVMNCSK